MRVALYHFYNFIITHLFVETLVVPLDSSILSTASRKSPVLMTLDTTLLQVSNNFWLDKCISENASPRKTRLSSKVSMLPELLEISFTLVN